MARGTQGDGLLKLAAALLAVPVLLGAAWGALLFGWLAPAVLSPGTPFTWRLAMLGAVAAPVCAALGLARAFFNRWTPAGRAFLVLGLGAAFWGPPGLVLTLLSGGLGISLLARGARDREPRTAPDDPPSLHPAGPWERALALAAVAIAAVAAVLVRPA